MTSSQTYIPDNYTSGVLKQDTYVDSYFLQANDSVNNYYELQEHDVESDHRLFSLGFRSTGYTFYSIANK